MIKKRKEADNQEIRQRNKKVIDGINQKIKEREDWYPEGDDKHAEVPTVKRRDVRDPNFLDDDSILGSRDETEDIGKLGKLVARYKSVKSTNTPESYETIKPEVSGHNDSSNFDLADFIDSLFK